MEDTQQVPESESLGDDIRKIVGGVVGLVLVIVPVLLIRKLVRTIEQSDGFKTIENHLK
jgi:hypothetical protein